jgi:hypothetical protein
VPLLKCRVCGYQASGWLDYSMHKLTHPTSERPPMNNDDSLTTDWFVALRREAKAQIARARSEGELFRDRWMSANSAADDAERHWRDTNPVLAAVVDTGGAAAPLSLPPIRVPIPSTLELLTNVGWTQALYDDAVRNGHTERAASLAIVLAAQ